MTRRLALMLAALLCTARVQAAGPTSDPATASNSLLTITENAPPTAPSNWGSGAQITASTDQTAATLKVSRPFPKIDNDYASFSNLSVVITTPITTSSTTVPSLDGLTNAYAAQLQFSQFTSSVTNDDAAKKQTRTELCQRMRSVAAIKATNDQDKKAAAAGTLPCTDANLLLYLGQEARQEYDAAHPGPVAGGFVWGAAIKVGYENFNYLDPKTAAMQSTSKAPASASAFVALNPERSNFLGTLSFEYQAIDKAATTASICPPTSKVPSTKCPVGAVGAPMSSEKELVSLELRMAFAKATVALTPTYDFKAKVYGFQLPVYLIPDKSGVLNGGVQMGWQSDTHKMSFGVVASAPLTTLF
jgi:hypothetical protein